MQSGDNAHSFMTLTAMQYRYKLRAYSGYLCSLVLAQILGMVLAYSGSGYGSTGGSTFHLTTHIYSAKLIFIFTVIWSFALSIMISSRASKDATFSLPGNRNTDSLSDLAFLLTGCLIGAVTTALTGAALRVILLPFIHGEILADGFYPAPGLLGMVALATFIYTLVLSAAGYFSGILLRISKLFIIPVGVLIVFLLYYNNAYSGSLSVLVASEQSYESGLPMPFIWIMLGIFAALYALGAVISSRMEVKK
jgi:hypothetical protein